VDRVTLPERFAGFCAGVVRRLPWGLNRLIPPNLLGFALINGFTFTCDLTLLTALHDVRTPAWLAVTVSYLCAFALSFVLNRALNFRSHGAVGGQLERYVLVVAVNYAAFILGVSTGLPKLGVEYHLARMAGGAGEAVFMYCALRWFVFRTARVSGSAGESGTAGESGAEFPDEVGGAELMADRADD
jgi:putative flippase GtrA